MYLDSPPRGCAATKHLGDFYKAGYAPGDLASPEREFGETA